MKIYTKKGDKGQTSLLGGTRLSKAHIRIASYGDVDELNSYIGLLSDQISIQKEATSLKTLLLIQDRLFTIGASLAADPKKNKFKLPLIYEKDVEFLEEEMDKMNESLPEMKSFVLPRGHSTVSFCHIARCVCRRAERNVINLSLKDYVNPIILKYLNRLSDYLFVLSRKFGKEYNVVEIPWVPKMEQ